MALGKLMSGVQARPMLTFSARKYAVFVGTETLFWGVSVNSSAAGARVLITFARWSSR